MERRSGFTLVELVVVILVLGILAGVASPKFFNTAATATDNGLQQSLSVVRGALELYAASNAGAFPACTGTGADFRTALIPHIRGAFPKCPVGPAQNTDVVPVSGATTQGDAPPTAGWKFNTANGVFICNYAAPAETDGSIAYDDF